MQILLPQIKRRPKNKLKPGESRKVFRMFKRLKNGRFLIAGIITKHNPPYGQN